MKFTRGSVGGTPTAYLASVRYPGTISINLWELESSNKSTGINNQRVRALNWASFWEGFYCSLVCFQLCYVALCAAVVCFSKEFGRLRVEFSISLFETWVFCCISHAKYPMQICVCIYIYSYVGMYISGQKTILHQPRFPWNKGISLHQLYFGVRSCEVAIIWPDI